MKDRDSHRSVQPRWRCASDKWIASAHAITRIAACALTISAVISMAGCTLGQNPGMEDVPPLPHFPPDVYADINPRWSHDGSRIAFLRSTPDRRLQLYLADSDLDNPFPLLEAELVCPDRPYSPGLRRYSSPNTIAWSPDDREIAFERTEWFKFDDGQRLPGTGLWSFDTNTGRVTPLILHAVHYTNLFYFYHTPAWSPDGRYLSFVAEGINGQRCIGIRALAAQKAKEVIPHFDNYASSDWPAWRAAPGHLQSARSDSTTAVLAYHQDIVRSAGVPGTDTLRAVQPGAATSVHSGELWRVTPFTFKPAAKIEGEPSEPRIGQIVWSPDGTRIAFTLSPESNDFDRYEIWTLSLRDHTARRVSPADGRGYFAPVWIDNRRIGALSPDSDHFRALMLQASRPSVRLLGYLPTSDCDWSPDRSKIAYSLPASKAPVSADNPITLRVLKTGIRARSPWRSEALDE